MLKDSEASNLHLVSIMRLVTSFFFSSRVYVCAAHLSSFFVCFVACIVIYLSMYVHYRLVCRLYAEMILDVRIVHEVFVAGRLC